MPKTESLDELIAQRAAEFADQIRAAAVMADKEEEIRIEVEKQLAFIQKDAGVKLEGRHEFTVAQGRADSVYQRVIIEYKNPKSPGARIGPKSDSPGTKKVIEQLKNRFYDMQRELGHPLNSMFGVGLDGNYFVFIRYRDNKWQPQDPVEVSKYSAERFLWALYNLGQKGKPFSSEYLAGDFGSDSPLAQDGVRTLYEAISTTDHPKAQVFFSQWKILFGEVCGYDVDNPSDKIKKLAEFYGIEYRRKLRPAELLFAVHSYYAIFMKLLASEIAAYFHKLPTPLQKMIQAGSSKALKREMEDLELGSIFRHLNITNFLEGDLFAWYTSVWSEPIEHLVRGMVARLDDYNPGTLSEEPASSRDLLKKLYQQLFPKSVRHDLGEYYTPDWLAEHVLNELAYVGDPDKRLLDPACGSGTFLVMAINRIRQWYDEHREQARFGEGELCQKILSNVVGFDLNPLAVMAARTNYLIAIRQLITRVDRVEIPIYLCDSVSTPFEYGELFENELGKVRKLNTAAGSFLVPQEIASSRSHVARYAELLENCISNDYSVDEFIERCHDEAVSVDAEQLHKELYIQLAKLKTERRNGIWARIIKNAFAPLFIGQADYVSGNPPWVRWAYLPQQYRNDIKPIWRQYGLFTQKGLESLMGTAEVDLSILFTYACIDHYLKPHGKLGFLITQEVVRSKTAGQGFRGFMLPQTMTPLRVDSFHDLVAISPFEASNKTGAVFLTKGKKTEYPVSYVIWKPKTSERIFVDDSLQDVLLKTARTSYKANPVSDLRSPWQVTASETETILAKLRGQSAFKGRRGASVDPYAVFICRVLSREPDGNVIVTNDPSLGRSDVSQQPPAKIEPSRVFPIIRGKDIQRWKAEPVYAAIIVNSSTRQADIPTESEVKRDLPKTYAYLNGMRSAALKRELFWQFFSKPFASERQLSETETKALGRYVRASGIREDGKYLYEIADGPFFVLFNIGSYTFSSYKVAWRRMGNEFKAAVVSEVEDALLGRKTVIPADTVSFVPMSHEEEAHYLCALVNSIPSRAAVFSFSSSGRGFGAPSVLQNLRLPAFDRTNRAHLALAALSAQAHSLAELGKEDELKSIETEINLMASGVWGIDPAELQILESALPKRVKRRKS